MDRNGNAVVAVVPPQVGGLRERGQVSRQPRDVGVVRSAAVRGLRAASRAGEIGRTGLSGHVDVTRSWMDRDGQRGIVLQAAAEPRGLRERGQRGRIASYEDGPASTNQAW